MRSRRGTIVGVGVVGIEIHITKNVINLWEEVVVGKLVIGVHGEEASICATTLPKNLMAHLSCMTLRGGVSETYCPNLQCRPQGGMGKTWPPGDGAKL
jgi:hypothetical protein